MAERVGVAALHHQDVTGDGLAERLDQPLRRLPGDLGEQVVADPLARHGGDLQHAPGGLGQRLHARQQQVPQRRGQLDALPVRRQQLLGEEGVALRAGLDLVDQRRVGRLAEDAGQQLGQLAAVQPSELQALGPAAALQLRQERPQRVAAVQLVAAVGQHQRHPAAKVPDQEAEQVAGGPVGPVQVLHHQQDTAVGGQAVQHPQQQLEQPARRGRARLAGRGRRRRRSELGHQAGQLGARPAERPLQLLRVQQPTERSQRLHHRRIGDRAVAHVQAAAAERQRPPPPHPLRQLADQPGLAHTGLARHHHRGGRAGQRAFEGRPELGGLGDAADQHGTGNSLRHGIHHRSTPPSPGNGRVSRRQRTAA
jgi:hypothetical protein